MTDIGDAQRPGQRTVPGSVGVSRRLTASPTKHRLLMSKHFASAETPDFTFAAKQSLCRPGSPMGVLGAWESRSRLR